MPRKSFPVPRMTLALLLALGLAFVVQAFIPWDVAPWGALWPSASGAFEPWQLFTYAFVHVDVGHLFNNLMLLGVAGFVLERDFGKTFVLTAFILCTLAAGWAAEAMMSLRMDNLHAMAVTVGASGAANGMAFLLLGWVGLDLWRHVPARRWLWAPLLLGSAVVFLGEDVLHFGEVPGGACTMAHEAHLGGALMGLLLLIGAGFRTRRAAHASGEPTGTEGLVKPSE
jgi:membrane associated rhomboid family serine protease